MKKSKHQTLKQIKSKNIPGKNIRKKILEAALCLRRLALKSKNEMDFGYTEQHTDWVESLWSSYPEIQPDVNPNYAYPVAIYTANAIRGGKDGVAKYENHIVVLFSRRLWKEVVATGETLGLWRFIPHSGRDDNFKPAALVLIGDEWELDVLEPQKIWVTTDSKPLKREQAAQKKRIQRERADNIILDSHLTFMKRAIAPTSAQLEAKAKELAAKGADLKEFIENLDTLDLHLPEIIWFLINEIETGLNEGYVSRMRRKTVNWKIQERGGKIISNWNPDNLREPSLRASAACFLASLDTPGRITTSETEDGEEYDNRVYTSFSLASRWIRKAFLHDGENIAQIDFVALHPNIVAKLLLKKGITPPDFLIGKSHDKIAKLLGISRDEAKLINLSFWNCKKALPTCPVLRFFLKFLKKNYHEVLDALATINEESGFLGADGKPLEPHKCLSRHLNHFEALVVSEALATLKAQGITANSCYDAIYTKASDAEAARKAMNAAAEKHKIPTTAKIG